LTASIKANVDGSAAIQVGGTDVITLTSGGAATFVTSPTTVQAGTAAAPSITTSGDTNTGIFFPAADTIAFAEGGVEVGRFDSSANFQFNSGYGSVATAYGCRAWVNFNGTGTVAIRASGNVSSITDNGTGDYTVNFTTAMPDANYAYSVAGNGWWATGGTLTASSFRMSTFSGGTFANSDVAVIPVAIFR
jgi:hypothetical protein